MSNTRTLLRKAFRILNQFMVWMYRLGLARVINCFPPVFGQIMILSHTGRKSGRLHRSGLNFAWVNGELYCTAGFGQGSDWYRNITADPNVQIWLNDLWFEATAEGMPVTAANLPILRNVLIGSGFASFAAGINPYRITDEALIQTASDYRLVHIQRKLARTGSGGPNDYAWILPVLAFITIPLLFRKRRR